MADSEVKKPTAPKPPASFMAFMGKYGWIAVVLVMVAQHFGLIDSNQAEGLKKQLQEMSQNEEAVPTPAPVPGPVPPPSPAPIPAPVPDVKPAPGPVTPEQIADMIRKILEESIKKPEPAPTPAEDVTPAPVPPAPSQPVTIRLCNENGDEIASNEVEDGQLFRVSAVGCGDSIGWHPVKSGDVRLSTSTDGKEFCGYLEAGQWIEFSLTDFASKTQASLRVTCLTAPQPPPGPNPPGPQPKPVDPITAGKVSLRVVHDVRAITPETAIVLNAVDTWNEFTAAGSDWLFYDVSSGEAGAKQAVRDASSTSLPALVVYDKGSGKFRDAIPLPKSVNDLRMAVASYTEGK